MTVEVLPGDCLAILAILPADSFDSCVTDPPYGLGFMGKGWDQFNPSEFQFWCRGWAEELFRVLKPGAYVVAFGGTRTYHRLACAIEDAGFEIRDCLQWIYGSGFPKSHDVSKGIDKAAGAEREIVGVRDPRGIYDGKIRQSEAINTNYREREGRTDFRDLSKQQITNPATDAARQWQGWGTALKPACEPIVLARKPLSEGTVAANVLRWGTGAINVDGCRAEGEVPSTIQGQSSNQGTIYQADQRDQRQFIGHTSGRWPANVVHDGSDEVVQGFPETKDGGGKDSRGDDALVFGERSSKRTDVHAGYGDSVGSAARFFYTAKADGDERIGSKHPTVKPIDLMQWLVRLVTPKGGTVLDPFAGTGTTGEAAWREGCRATLIEREAEYLADIARRLELMKAGPDERAREIVKASGKAQGHEDLPLWGVR